MSFIQGLIPPTKLERAVALQSILSAFATGSFLTGTAVFFTRIVGLSAAQVGLGLSISGVVVLGLSVPLGRLSDQIGSRRIWVIAALLEALLYFAWPSLRGFALFSLMLSVLAAVETAGRSGRNAYVLEVFPREQRVRSMAFIRAARNIGYTMGAAAGGFALAIGTRTAIEAVPVVTGGLLLINALMVVRLPQIDVRAPVATEGLPGPAGLKNKGFVALGICNGILSTHQVLLNVVVPLWLVERTDAPHVLLAWLFGTNTVMAVFLTVRTAQGAETISGALRATNRGAACMVASCGIIAVTHDTAGWASIVLIWLGHVTITGAELWQSAAGWGLLSELSDPQRLGEYQGVWNLGFQVESIVGPALFTYLAINVGNLGWVAIAVLILAAAAATYPATRAAERHLAAHVTSSSPAVANLTL